MPHIIVVGAQWGDEGKAKVIDLLAESADMVIRCQGGCNAGHTVQRGQDVFKFHLLPSGMLYPGKQCVIGPGTVIHPEVLLKEIQALQARGYQLDGLRISDRAHITLPFHLALDQQSETALGEKKIGTTGRGIGPTYMDKVGRMGLRMGDLLDEPSVLREKLRHLAEIKRPALSALPSFNACTVESLTEDWFSFCREALAGLGAYIIDTIPWVHQAIDDGKNLLFEGAQGALLDVDYGTYPFVTSSNATAGGACTGSGIGPTRIEHTLGVMKAYLTRVGEGPFPTELTDETGRYLAEVGREVGTTTGRARRCGWFDAVVGRYSARINGLDSLAVTKLDVLDGLDEIRLCVAYRHLDTGEVWTDFPSRLDTLARMEPVYETLPGWKATTSHLRTYAQLPEEAKAYLQRLAEVVGAPASMVSVGPERDQTITVFSPSSRRS